MPANPFTSQIDPMLADRLSRVSEQLRTLVLTTAEDYQAEIYSTVNAVLAIGMAMTPLSPIGAKGPAIVGDAVTNYTQLNNDAKDVANEMLNIEGAVASYFNLAATTQNQLRQQIREFIYAPNQQRYSGNFLNSRNLTNVTANLDFNAGLATNSLVSSTQITPTITIGPNSVGVLDPSSSLSFLTDKLVNTFLQWNGTSLEISLTFPNPQIMNRIVIRMDNYSELEIDTFTTSPDGNLVEDKLGALGIDNILMNSSSSKFSGDVIIDFPPSYVQTARIIINDRVGSGQIALRELACYQIAYSSTGQLTSTAIISPTGSVLFSATQNVFAPYVSITHQISYDGTQFIVINPGDTLILARSPFFYRANLATNTSIFDSVPLLQTTLDPVASAYYTLNSAISSPLGNGVLQRSLQINGITGPIILRDNLLPNSLVIQEGSVILSPNGDYTFVNNTITFPGATTGLTISYQTSSLGPAAVRALEGYYTACLYEFKFEAAY